MYRYLLTCLQGVYDDTKEEIGKLREETTEGICSQKELLRQKEQIRDDINNKAQDYDWSDLNEEHEQLSRFEYLLQERVEANAALSESLLDARDCLISYRDNTRNEEPDDEDLTEEDEENAYLLAELYDEIDRLVAEIDNLMQELERSRYETDYSDHEKRD